jgi:hypothetical protein
MPDWAREPFAGTDNPVPKGIEKDNADRSRSIVERPRGDWVDLRQAKCDRDEANPEHGQDRDWVRELAEVERSSHEFVRVDDTQGDGQPCYKLVHDLQQEVRG